MGKITRPRPKRVNRDDDNPTKRTITGTELSPSGQPVEVEAVPDFFDHSDFGGKEQWVHNIEILVTEWAFFYPNHTPYGYLTQCKSYSHSQSVHILGYLPASQWAPKRTKALDKLTEGLVKRHVDKLAEVQEQHISASKLGLAQAVKMLANGSTEPLRDRDGKVLLDSRGQPRFRAFRSIDLVNCMTAIEKAQMIYRRAMGLPNDGGGLKQILDKVEEMNQTVNNVTNIQVNTTQATPDSLSYDDIMLLIELKREQKAKIAAPEDALKIDPKPGVPTGDFTNNGAK
jgi:hypothetical protein